MITVSLSLPLRCEFYLITPTLHRIRLHQRKVLHVKQVVWISMGRSIINYMVWTLFTHCHFRFTITVQTMDTTYLTTGSKRPGNFFSHLMFKYCNLVLLYCFFVIASVKTFPLLVTKSKKLGNQKCKILQISSTLY